MATWGTRVPPPRPQLYKLLIQGSRSPWNGNPSWVPGQWKNKIWLTDKDTIPVWACLIWPTHGWQDLEVWEVDYRGPLWFNCHSDIKELREFIAHRARLTRLIGFSQPPLGRLTPARLVQRKGYSATNAEGVGSSPTASTKMTPGGASSPYSSMERA